MPYRRFTGGIHGGIPVAYTVAHTVAYCFFHGFRANCQRDHRRRDVDLEAVARFIIIKKLQIPTRMAYLISIGSTVCGTTAIMATAPVIKANKSEISYAIANITLFGILSMLLYPYFANFIFKETHYLQVFF